MTEELSVMEAVSICGDIYNSKKEKLDEKDFEAIYTLYDYADMKYISHVEDIGYAIPQIMEQVEEQYKDRAVRAMCLANCKGFQECGKCFSDDCEIKRKFLKELYGEDKTNKPH